MRFVIVDGTWINIDMIQALDSAAPDGTRTGRPAAPTVYVSGLALLLTQAGYDRLVRLLVPDLIVQIKEDSDRGWHEDELEIQDVDKEASW